MARTRWRLPDRLPLCRGGEWLAEALQDHDTLRLVDLRGNAIGDVAVGFLLQLACPGPSLFPSPPWDAPPPRSPHPAHIIVTASVHLFAPPPKAPKAVAREAGPPRHFSPTPPPVAHTRTQQSWASFLVSMAAHPGGVLQGGPASAPTPASRRWTSRGRGPTPHWWTASRRSCRPTGRPLLRRETGAVRVA